MPTAALPPTATPGTPPLPLTPYPTRPADWEAPFALGGHIRSAQYINAMKYAGMTWTKRQVHHPGEAAYVFIQESHDLGFKIQLTALGDPKSIHREDYVEEYITWVSSLAAAGADAIEVWNEPNIDREWTPGHISPEAYTALLCSAYDAIKAANPDTVVISAAPAPTGYFAGCWPTGCDDEPFLRGMAEAGATDCMDYIGAHHNAGATSPAADIGHPARPTDTHHSWYFLPQTRLYYSIFGGHKQIFYTEMGYAAQEGVTEFSEMFAWASGTSVAQQADWVAGTVALARNTGMVQAIMVWNVWFPRYEHDPQDGFAIIRPEGSCPTCETLHNALVRTAPPSDQDRTTLRLPWPAGLERCIVSQTLPDHPDGFTFDLEFEAVLAAHSGWVTEVRQDTILGNIVLLCRDQDATNECSQYGHLDTAIVSVGQYVERGQEIALSGNIESTGQPGLFFALSSVGKTTPPIFDEMDGGLSSKSCYISQNERR